MADPTDHQGSGTSPSVLQSAFWLMAAKTVAFAFSFVVPLFLVRHMSQKDFGLYKQAFLAVNTVVAIFPLGFVMSAFYFLPRESEKKKQVVFNILLFYLATGAGASMIMVLRPDLLAAIFNAADLIEYAPLIGAVMLVWITGSFFEFVAVANGEAPLAAGFLVVVHFSRAVLFTAAAIFFTSLHALLYAALIHGVLQTAASLVYLDWRFPRFWRRFDASLMRSQLAYALPLGLVGLLYYLQADLHQYFVSNRFGPELYAIYAVGCFELPLLGILIESIRSVMIARVSTLRHENNRREIIELSAQMMRTLGMVFLPVYALLLVVGREFITFLFTAQYIDSWPIFAINLTLIPLSILSSFTDPVFRAYPEHRFFLLATRTLTFALLLIGLWFGVKQFFLLGAVGVVVAINFIEVFAFGIKAARILGMAPRDLPLFKDLGKLAGASLIAGAVAAAAREAVLGMGPFAVLAMCGVVFALVYVLAVFLLEVPTPEEMQKLRDGAGRLSLHGLWRKAARLSRVGS
ncbi:MAG TPA: lipopolysaccharide biosynthesis protein [Candidatus Binatia bacterium]|jgi:O-antigen/teichoic acid export membrane protein